jgi:mono/diheme cytochrome c family protein
MKHVSVLAIPFIALALWPAAASAQQDGLDAQQTTGRQVFAQSCGVCHLQPVMNARTYGPSLSRETAGGNAEVIRGIISDGTPRMPAFKHYLDRPQIDAIIAYLTTVKPAAPPPPRAERTPQGE